MYWKQIGNDWYLQLDRWLLFQGSLDKCNELVGHLAVIRDQASHDAIYSLTGKEALKIFVL
jgi:hypothetical protein